MSCPVNLFFGSVLIRGAPIRVVCGRSRLLPGEIGGFVGGDEGVEAVGSGRLLVRAVLEAGAGQFGETGETGVAAVRVVRSADFDCAEWRKGEGMRSRLLRASAVRASAVHGSFQAVGAI